MRARDDKLEGRPLRTEAESGACGRCRRRSRLLGELGVLLDFHTRNEARLLELLALEDAELIQAIGGRRRQELLAEWEAFADGEPGRACAGQDAAREAVASARPGEPCARAGTSEPLARAHPAQAAIADVRPGEPCARERAVAPAGAVQTMCIHTGDSPLWSRRSGMPRMLHVVGGAQRLAALFSEPAVAIVGSTRPTDYGMEMARSLARGLAASGVTVVSGFANGIAASAHAGALEAQGASVTVMAGGVDVVTPASRRGLYERVIERGCAVAELPCGQLARRWCEPARARAIAALADMTIVVEAGERPSELRGARAAQALGRTVAALPGRVTSPASLGTNALLMAGAPLVRGAADALDLLYGAGGPANGIGAPEHGLDDPRHGLGGPRNGLDGHRHGHGGSQHEHCDPGHGQGEPRRDRSRAQKDAPADPARLRPRLRAILEQVGAGRDTPGKLTTAGADPGETLLALSELELMGLLGRGDGDRYVPRESLTGLDR